MNKRKKAEEALRASEELHRHVNNATYDQIYSYDLENRFTSANRQLCVNLKRDLTEIIGKSYWEFGFPEELCLYWDELHQKVYANGSIVEIVSTPMPDGSLQYFEVNLTVMKNDQGEIIGIAGVNRNITERKKAEDALIESRNRYHALFEQAGDGIITLDTNGKILKMNETYARMHGYSEEEILKISLYSQNTIGNEGSEERIRRILAGETLSFEVEHFHKDGHSFPLMVTANLIKVGSEQFIIAIHRDLTERKHLEEEMQKSHKLESLGILAGGIAHDFNNLLGGIYGYIDMAIEKASDERSRDEKLFTHLSKAMSTIERARGLTLQLLTFSKGGTPIKKIGSLFPFVAETVQFVLSGSSVLAKIDIPENLPTCEFDKNQIGQVIDNIVINAKQAMPEGGTIEVSSRSLLFTENEHPSLSRGLYIMIAVKDQGIGIPKNILPRIFDPFYTTKSSGHGLGLATCYSIIKRHGGCIEVESEPGKGSTFRIYLPASEQFHAMDTEKLNMNHQGQGLFLVMDDQEVLRDILSEMLHSFGYTPVTTEDGQKAIDIVSGEAKANRKIAGMIFDLTIPGAIGGKEAIVEIRKINSDTPVFVASGYAEDPVMANPTLYGFTASICKPFKRTELSELLNKFM